MTNILTFNRAMTREQYREWQRRGRLRALQQERRQAHLQRVFRTLMTNSTSETRWEPDTCENPAITDRCVIACRHPKDNPDDISFCLLLRCSAHQHLPLGWIGGRAVYEENVRKNHAEGLLREAMPSLTWESYLHAEPAPVRRVFHLLKQLADSGQDLLNPRWKPGVAFTWEYVGRGPDRSLFIDADALRLTPVQEQAALALVATLGPLVMLGRHVRSAVA